MPGPPTAIETTKPQSSHKENLPCGRPRSRAGGGNLSREAHREPTQRPKNLPGLRWVRTGPGPWWASSLPHPLPARPSGWGEGCASLPGERRRLARRPLPQAARASGREHLAPSRGASGHLLTPAALQSSPGAKDSGGLRAPCPVPARPGVRRAEWTGQQRASVQPWLGLDAKALAAGGGVVQPAPRFSRRTWRKAAPLSPHPSPLGLGLGCVRVSPQSTQGWDLQAYWAVR